MFKVFILADKKDRLRKLSSELGQRGFTCFLASYGEEALEEIICRDPDLVLIATNGSPASPGMRPLTCKIKEESHLPILALIPREALDSLDTTASIDDFVIEPWDVSEVAARIKRLLRRTNNTDDGNLIKRGDLVMDLARCEVTLCGRRIALTFKEYELLRFLASNKGRVFTRDALLNKVWGYDYFGGERTVDVHIRRLRGKIEDANHTFIDTVRNIGYKFAEG